VSVLSRWLRFNLVGAMGMVVQLGSLALMSRVWVGHVLVVTAIAVELAVLHNFAWHVRYTWRGREGGSRWRQMVRFHLANGAVSLVGSVVLMRLLVGEARLPVMAANVVAIACCSVVNFGLGERWAFAAAHPPSVLGVKSAAETT
jgi:putative flippase GtrA